MWSGTLNFIDAYLCVWTGSQHPGITDRSALLMTMKWQKMEWSGCPAAEGCVFVPFRSVGDDASTPIPQPEAASPC